MNGYEWMATEFSERYRKALAGIKPLVADYQRMATEFSESYRGALADMEPLVAEYWRMLGLDERRPSLSSGALLVSCTLAEQTGRTSTPTLADQIGGLARR